MPKIHYRAKNARGRLINASIDATSENRAIEILNAKGYTEIEIKKNFLAGLKNLGLTNKNAENGRVKMSDIAVFARQLATMVNAGVNILEAVTDVSMMVQNRYFANILQRIVKDIKNGIPLSQALSKHKKIFDNTFVSMIAVGERSGQLGEVLTDLAEYIENSVKLRRKIKSAAAYPTFVGSFFIVVFLGIVLFLIPKFEEMFASFGADLPALTKFVVAISHFVLDRLGFIIVGLIVLFIIFKIVTKTPKGLLMWHKSFFKVPIFGPIYTKMIFARYFQTLSTLVKSGVDIVVSIQISASTVNNTYIKQILENIRSAVISGQSFSANMEKYNVFPRLVIRMTAVGEKTGQMDEMFMKVTDYYNEEVNTTVASLSSIIEPVLIVGLGIMVGFIVVALYLPIFSMAGAMVNQQV
ncbi:MAG: type II secretion system F family protein [Elusimicrobia bacterium]|nr:type II secretion system F family protein [Elusimicrobiota bacterium]